MSHQNNASPVRRRVNLLLLILIIPGLLSALALAMGRYRVESHNRAVELVLDYGELQNLSVSSGTPLPAVIQELKKAGATGIAISEQTLGDLIATGQASYTQRASDAGSLTVIRIANRQLAGAVFRALSIRIAPQMVSPRPSDTAEAQAPDAIVVRAAPLTLNTMGIGLPPDAVKLAEQSGMDVVARLVNSPSLTSTAIDSSFKELKDQGIARLICAGEEVIGFRGLVPHAAEQMKADDLVYGSVEFGKQKGDAKMGVKLDSEFLRVHSISPAELATLSPSDAVERFVRAARERNIRLCYIRLPETVGEQPLADGTAFVSQIHNQLAATGYQPGIARPFEEPSRPLPLLFLIALSVVAAGVLTIDSLISLSRAWKIGLTALGLLFAAGLVLKMGEMGLKGIALLSALVFPTLGAVALVGPHFFRETGEKHPVRIMARLFIGMSAVSLCGALVVVGLLADRVYMVKTDQFAGIKVAHLFPLLIVMAAMTAGLPLLGKPFSQVRDEVSANIRKVVGHPLFVWHALAVVFAMVVIGMALLRTGNEPGVGVSGLELKFRAVLDKLMVVRPRTKEFMIGHPAMILGIGMLLTRRRAWGLPLVVFGMLGQVSLLNTFCHIHTPLAVSVLRAANGLILGLVLGIAAWLIIDRLSGRSAKGKM